MCGSFESGRVPACRVFPVLPSKHEIKLICLEKI
jgi:hypothetical protein